MTRAYNDASFILSTENRSIRSDSRTRPRGRAGSPPGKRRAERVLHAFLNHVSFRVPSVWKDRGLPGSRVRDRALVVQAEQDVPATPRAARDEARPVPPRGHPSAL